MPSTPRRAYLFPALLLRSLIINRVNDNDKRERER